MWENVLLFVGMQEVLLLLFGKIVHKFYLVNRIQVYLALSSEQYIVH